jgi:hypothetical protein
MRKRLKALVLAQYFAPDMGGGSARTVYVARVCWVEAVRLLLWL